MYTYEDLPDHILICVDHATDWSLIHEYIIPTVLMEIGWTNVDQHLHKLVIERDKQVIYIADDE